LEADGDTAFAEPPNVPNGDLLPDVAVPNGDAEFPNLPKPELAKAVWEVRGGL